MPEPKNPEMKSQKIAPLAVDFNVIGKCNLRCEWCWGPDHKMKANITSKEWIDIAKELKKLGTKSIVITGGEPLLRNDLIEILVGLKKIGMRVTLSTNGMLLSDKNKELLKYVDEMGLPLDGSNKDANSLMRKGDKRSFELAMSAIKFVQETYPKIKLTIRTVLSKKNADDIVNIPEALKANGVNIETIRWKIYQIAATGPTKEYISSRSEEWLIDDDNAKEVVTRIKDKYGEKLVEYQDTSLKLNRYLHIDPRGKMFTLVGDGTEEMLLGDVFDDKRKLVIKKPLTDLDNSENKITDTKHGTDNF
jgi:MoaA/NifB/PqqE/SkfB family radical SAM enzyme